MSIPDVKTATLGPCTQAELDAFEGLDSKSKQLFQMWVDRALRAETELAARCDVHTANVAWLIEMPERFGPLYFHFEHDDDWTKDHDKAVRFARRQDAEQVIAHYGWTRALAVEHMWVEPKSSPLPSANRGGE